MALAAAQKKVAGIVRDVKSADILAGPMSSVNKRFIALANTSRPLIDLIALIKVSIITVLLPVLELFADVIRRVIQILLTFGLTLKLVADVIVDTIAYLIAKTVGFFPGLLVPMAADSLKDAYAPYFVEIDKALKKIKEELERGNEDKVQTDMNQMMGSIGVQLTDNRWNPWQENAANATNGGSK